MSSTEDKGDDEIKVIMKTAEINIEKLFPIKRPSTSCSITFCVSNRTCIHSSISKRSQRRVYFSQCDRSDVNLS